MCLHECHLDMQSLRRPEKGVKRLGTDCCEQQTSCQPPCGYRELNPGPLEDRAVLLTLSWSCLSRSLSRSLYILFLFLFFLALVSLCNRLALNSLSSYLHLPSAGMTQWYHPPVYSACSTFSSRPREGLWKRSPSSSTAILIRKRRK